MLSDRIGLDPAVGRIEPRFPGPSRLRMGELGLGSPGRLCLAAAGSATELQALIEEVVIPESWFFRDETALPLLPGVRRDAAGSPTRHGHRCAC